MKLWHMVGFIIRRIPKGFILLYAIVDYYGRRVLRK